MSVPIGMAYPHPTVDRSSMRADTIRFITVEDVIIPSKCQSATERQDTPSSVNSLFSLTYFMSRMNFNTVSGI